MRYFGTPYWLGGPFAGSSRPSLGQGDDVLDLINKVDGLFGKIPESDPVWGTYKARLDKCMDSFNKMTILTAYSVYDCFRDLYKDVKDYLDAQEKPKPAPAPPPPVVVQESPILPILLAAGAGVGAALLLS